MHQNMCNFGEIGVMIAGMMAATTKKEPVMVYEFGRFVFLGEYEDRELPKAARFFWDPRRKAWVTSSFRCAAGLLKYADRDARSRILDRVMGPEREPALVKGRVSGRINPVRHR